MTTGNLTRIPHTIMRCERCQRDKRTERYDVDGFTGYLCAECRKEWETLQKCA